MKVLFQPMRVAEIKLDGVGCTLCDARRRFLAIID